MNKEELLKEKDELEDRIFYAQMDDFAYTNGTYSEVIVPAKERIKEINKLLEELEND